MPKGTKVSRKDDGLLSVVVSRDLKLTFDIVVDLGCQRRIKSSEERITHCEKNEGLD